MTEMMTSDGPVLKFDAPNGDMDGAIVAKLRYGVAKTIASLMFDKTKLYSPPGNIYARIAFMLGDEDVTSYLEDFTQLETYYAKPLYKDEWPTEN